MNPGFLPSLFTLIGIATVLILAPTKAFGQSEYAACGAPYRCGDIQNISYPFSGAANRPAYCGYPGFNLSCESNTLLYHYQGIPYRVLGINYTAQTVTVARNDLWDTRCPQTGYRNTSFDFNLFNYINGGGDQNATLFYGCSQVLPVTTFNQFSCNVNGTTTNGYLVGVDPSLVPDTGLCRVNIFVPVKNQSLPGTLQLSPSEDALTAALRGGFGLRWTAQKALCDGCVQSGGQCGSNTSSPNPTFACYCADRTYPARCNDLSGNEGGSTPPPQGSSNKSSQLPIVLPVVGAILAGIGIGWAFFRCKQRRKRQAAAAGAAVEAQGKTKELPTSISSKPLIANASSNLTTSIPSYPSSASTTEFGQSFYFGTQVFTYEELNTATENFDSRHELGEGGFGTVYYGRLVDGREVAVKRLYENNFKRVEQFLNEVEILTKLHHKNLVQLYGCTSRRSRELVLVYEYIANGTVADHLHGKLARSGASGLLSWPVRLNIAIETSEALTYLHESDIIHRDVKTNNILLEKNFRVKVADFGLSRLFPNDVTHVSTAPQGTPGYVDPEYYQCYQITNKSDVYSFGVVLIELISSLQAVDTNRHRHDINLANMAINKIQNHSLNELVDKSLGFETDGTVRRTITLVAELAFRCLQHERDMRPSMKEVLETLKGIQNEDLNVQKAEVLDIVIDTAFPPSPDSGVTDKTTSNGSMPSSSDKMIDISAR